MTLVQKLETQLKFAKTERIAQSLTPYIFNSLVYIFFRKEYCKFEVMIINQFFKKKPATKHVH